MLATSLPLSRYTKPIEGSGTWTNTAGKTLPQYFSCSDQVVNTTVALMLMVLPATWQPYPQAKVTGNFHDCVQLFGNNDAVLLLAYGGGLSVENVSGVDPATMDQNQMAYGSVLAIWSLRH